jgi:hypothetical protein
MPIRHLPGGLMHRTKIAAVVALLAVVAAGCGSSKSSSTTGSAKAPNPNAKEVSPSGDIPDGVKYIRFAVPGAGFSVTHPEGFSQSQSGGAVLFTDKLNTIRLETAPGGKLLTVAAAKNTLVPKLAQANKGFQLKDVTIVHRTAGNALRIMYLADAAPNPVTGKAGVDAVEEYVFSNGGRRAVVTLSGPNAADNVDPWRIVTNSLRWSA